MTSISQVPLQKNSSELSNKTINNPPNLDEIEICLFGSGFGESLVVHLGNSEWIIVDSCVFKGSTSSAPLNYLQKISVDYSNDVKLVVATHWDDDHIKGIGQVVENCINAKFGMSAAINDKKFTRIVVDSPLSQAIRLGQTVSTGITEFNKIFHSLKNNGKVPTYALPNTTLWTSEKQQDTEVIALSPHATAFEKAIQSILAQIPSDQSPIGNIKAPKPNHTSVVLWIKTGNSRLLLGADLEEHSTQRGWSLILEDKTSLDKKAEVYKVAHHGSATGDHEGIWRNLLIENPVCLIAPWKWGGKTLPKDSDITRILNKNAQLHITSDLKENSTFKSRNKHVKRALSKINAKPLLNDFSMIRLRKKTDHTEWSYEHFGSAFLKTA